MPTESQQHFYELLGDFDSAMLVTSQPNGELRSRPMAIGGVSDNGKIYFATSKTSAKNAEIHLDNHLALTMQSDSKFLSLTGHGRITDDKALIDKYYSTAWKLWFPEGKDDPSLSLIEVDPSEGEYWDQSGGKRLEFLWEAGKALATGEKIDADHSGHQKVSL